MAIDLDYLAKSYFWFDKPVPYKVTDGKIVTISPVSVEDSEMFLSWMDIISIDKNALNDVQYISMSYLEFLITSLIVKAPKEVSKYTILKLASILRLCLGWEGEINIGYNERKKPVLLYKDIVVSTKQFEDIRRIILYQNLLDFDDSYVNPDIKQAMAEVDEIKSKGIDYPNLERKMAIITAHTGLSKAEQMKMTYRSHTALMKEVYGEVDYLSARIGVMVGNMFSKNKIDFEDWIYRKKHNKYEQYFTAEDSYNRSMGGASIVRDDGSVDFDRNIDLSSFIK